MSLSLDWLPVRADWAEQLAAAQHSGPDTAWFTFRALANSRIDFVSANRLDKAIQKCIAKYGLSPVMPSIKVALLGSSSLAHLVPGIRLGALRRGLLAEVHVGDYGMYRQELMDSGSPVHVFMPDVVVLALDAEHLAGAADADAGRSLDSLKGIWKTAQSLGAVVLQQTLMPRYPALMGNNEDRLRQSPAAIVRKFNSLLRERAEDAAVHLLALDEWVEQNGGITEWFDAGLWHLAKHEVRHAATPLYGDQVGRVLAAVRGRSAKCLVLDLDNTLWGGVISDDGLGGIVLGQGTAAGEAHLDLQRYAKRLSQRGIILAVCSKNDEENALAPFRDHPEMILRTADIACFVANWQDKAQNLKYIAQTLNIGLDSLAFVDDNPAERALVRRELPMVAVPELPDDPAEYVRVIASAGYFEALDLTTEDRDRAAQYRANASREAMRNSATDLQGFLESLKMELTWSPFNRVDLKRITQLINKTNQFNLTTQRYTETNVVSIMEAEDQGRFVTLQLRLNDIYGENGIIALVVAKKSGFDLEIDTWLMSCRVLGREVEYATLNVLAQRAPEVGCKRILGIYKPSGKNAMVCDLYPRLGFEPLEPTADGSTRWALSLHAFQPKSLPMRVIKGASCQTTSSIAS